MDTYAKTRIDILVEAPFRKHLCDLVNRHGVSGYTVFPALAGRGDQTAWLRSGLISDVGKMELVVGVVVGRAQVTIRADQGRKAGDPQRNDQDQGDRLRQ